MGARVAAGAARARQSTDLQEHEGTALILDAEDAATGSALVAEGFLSGRVLVPNIIPSVARSLRKEGFVAWAGRIESYLRSPIFVPFDLLYLDHTGALPGRVVQIWDAFRQSVISAGSVVACTFSTRAGNGQDDVIDSSQTYLPQYMPKGWSAAHAVYALVHVLFCAAAEQGLAIHGSDEQGLSDYTFQFPSCTHKPHGSVGECHPLCEDPQEMTSSTAQPAPRRGNHNYLPDIRDALVSADTVRLADVIHAWAMQEGPPPGQKPSGEVGFLARKAALISGRLLPGLVGTPRILGAAACTTHNRVVPHAVLGSASALCDADVSMLFNIAAKVVKFHDMLDDVRHDMCVENCISGHTECASLVRAENPPVVLRRCLLLYPEQMMFMLVRVVHPVAGVSVKQ